MDWAAKTIETYNESAVDLSEYFSGIGSRADDIEVAIGLLDKKDNIRAVEIGCGDGRDGVEIANCVQWYEGFDPSSGLLKLARERSIDTSFVEADALSYDFPKDIDLVFAFASLLHLNKADTKTVCEKVSNSLNVGGIFYMSLKERENYEEELQDDKFGKRMFYYYNPALIKDIAGESFRPVYEDQQQIGKTTWFTLGLMKVSP